jgi:hypothetical protein
LSIGVDIQLLHLRELVQWGDFVLVAFDVFPVESAGQGNNDFGDGGNNIVFSVKGVGRERGGQAVHGLSKSFEETLVVYGGRLSGGGGIVGALRPSLGRGEHLHLMVDDEAVKQD